MIFSAVTIGSITGVFYPSLVQAFKKSAPSYVGPLEPRSTRLITFVISGILIGIIISATSFATFLGNAANQKALLDLGFAAYFLAFSAGFTAASVAEELVRAK
jgi:hypothetical protein